jgi:chromosome segregation ATPase
MGALVSAVRAWWSPAPPPSSSLLEVTQLALDELRGARRALEGRAANKRRTMETNACSMIEIGLRRHTNARLTAADRHELRRLFRAQERLERSHELFVQQLVNLDTQIDALEDAPALEQSYGSLASGMEARQTRIRETTALVHRVRAEMQLLLAPRPVTTTPSTTGVVDDSDAALTQRLEALMANDEFIASNVPRDRLDEVRQRLAEASVPTFEPAATKTAAILDPYDAEAALGL